MATEKDAAPEGSIEHTADKGKRLRGEALAQRNHDLVVDRLQPMSWAALAAKYGISDRMCRKIFYAWAKKNEEGRTVSDFQGRDPIEIVWESAARYERWIEQLARLAFGAEVQDSVRVGAINSASNIQQKLIDLLQATGILPKQLGKLRIEADIRYVAQAILQVFDEEGVPEQTRERVIRAIQSASSRN